MCTERHHPKQQQQRGALFCKRTAAYTVKLLYSKSGFELINIHLQAAFFSLPQTPASAPQYYSFFHSMLAFLSPHTHIQKRTTCSYSTHTISHQLHTCQTVINESNSSARQARSPSCLCSYRGKSSPKETHNKLTLPPPVWGQGETD